MLQERLGVFGELFGVVRQVAGETKAQVESSIISGEFSNREPFLAELSKTKGLPSMKQLEGLWYALQQEMTAQGEVKTFEGKNCCPRRDSSASTDYSCRPICCRF